MKSVRRLIQHYFAFSSRETNAFLLLVPTIALLVSTPYFYRHYLISHAHSIEDMEANQEILAEMEAKIKKERTLMVKRETRRLNPVRFDPNTVSKDQMLAMGLSERVAGNIVNYRLKGGSFRTRNDLARIYSLSEKDFNTLYGYIDLPEEMPVRPAKQKVTETVEAPPTALVFIDINQASAAELMDIRGIGEKLSQRIIAFRSGLGGFHTTRQLKEVYGLKEDIVAILEQRFVVTDTFKISQLDLLSASMGELARHPYISFQVARVLVAYRDQHRIDSMEQLMEIKIMTDSLYTKLTPYLRLGDEN